MPVPIAPIHYQQPIQPVVQHVRKKHEFNVVSQALALNQGDRFQLSNRTLSISIPSAPLYGGRRPTPGENIGHMIRSIKYGVKGAFIHGLMPDPQKVLHKPWQRILNKILPGDTVMAILARDPQRTSAEKAILSRPETRVVDPRWMMPNLVFDRGAESFPVSADFDRDGNVNNNAFTYQHRNVQGNQSPHVYVHSQRKGEYTVMQYWLYFADNKYSNYHNHDWQRFAVYLKETKQGLKPEYLMTHWHKGRHMEKWENLKLDTTGRPFIKVDKGAHALMPYSKKDALPHDSGLTMTPEGTFYQRNRNKVIPNHLTFVSMDKNLVGVKQPRQLPDGSNVMTYDKYFQDNRIMGFFTEKKGIHLSSGPARSSLYSNPHHPTHFFNQRD